MQSESIRLKKWFIDHPLFKVAGMCAQVKIDKSNFQRILKGDIEIPEKMIQKILPVVYLYGFTPEIWGPMEEFQKTTSFTKRKEIPVQVKPEENTFIKAVDKIRIQSQINELEKELKSPPKNSALGIHTWKKIKQKQINDLRKLL